MNTASTEVVPGNDVRRAVPSKPTSPFGGSIPIALMALAVTAVGFYRPFLSRLITRTVLVTIIPALGRMFNRIWDGMDGLIFSMNPTYIFVLTILAIAMFADWRTTVCAGRSRLSSPGLCSIMRPCGRSGIRCVGPGHRGHGMRAAFLIESGRILR